MRLALRLSALASVVLGGCASAPPKPASGPEDYSEVLEWCAPEVVEKYRREPAAPRDQDCAKDDDDFCTRSARAVSDCVRFLQRESPRNARWVYGRFIFGVTTDSKGAATNICLIDTNLGNTPETLLCVARVAREEVKFEADQKDWPWKVTWVLE